MKPRRSILKVVAVWTVLAIVAVPTFGLGVWRVLQGQGAGAYVNVYGLAIHYTSVVILVAVVILILGGVFIARAIHLRRFGEASEIPEPTPYTDPGDKK